MLLGLDVDVVDLPSTPLAACSSRCCSCRSWPGAGLLLLSTLGTPLVDRRWPADEPLDPTEMLWGESGGYIKRHFPGLDVEIGKDINSQFTEVKVPAGEAVVEQGDPATHFYVVKSGEVQVTQRAGRRLRAGHPHPRRRATRSARSASSGARRERRRIRAVGDAVVLQLPAEEFVAGVAFSAAEGNELLSRVNEYLAADAERAEQVVPDGAGGAGRRGRRRAGRRHDDDLRRRRLGRRSPPPTSCPPPACRPGPRPIPTAEPVATLGGGVELRVVGESGAWARVVGVNGWEGWVDGRLLQAR